MHDAFAIAFMTSQREQLRALLLWLDAIPEEKRADVRAGSIQALGAIEDALGVERTLPRKYQREAERVRRMERGKETGAHLRDVVD
jgi:hypothetical protein